MSISTAVPTWLQCVDRTTAEATKATQDAIEATVPELDRLSYLFDSSVSLVNTDRYAANFKAERAKKQQQDQYVHNHYGCDVHAAARSVKHLLTKVDGHISGMIAGGLSMTDAGSTRVFRECVSQVLEDRLVVRLGMPPNDCVKHTIAVLNLFWPLPGNPQSATDKCTRTRVKQLEKQRATLLFFLNGDISDTTLVEFYTLDWNSGSAADAKEKVLRAMQRFLVPALAHKGTNSFKKVIDGRRPGHRLFWHPCILPQHPVPSSSTLYQADCGTREASGHVCTRVGYRCFWIRCPGF